MVQKLEYEKKFFVKKHYTHKKVRKFRRVACVRPLDNFLIQYKEQNISIMFVKIGKIKQPREYFLDSTKGNADQDTRNFDIYLTSGRVMQLEKLKKKLQNDFIL